MNIQQEIANSVLIIVDIQYDFCENGSLAVNNSLDIIPIINDLRNSNKFSYIVLTKDYHPEKHVSFASTHGKNPFQSIEIDQKKQELWPDHCIIATRGSELHENLLKNQNDIIVHKGTKQQYDSYSGFGTIYEDTGLLAHLQQRNIQNVFCVGLAYDYCVGSTAIDACVNNFQTYIIKEATRSVNEKTQDLMQKRLQQFSNYQEISIQDLDKIQC